MPNQGILESKYPMQSQDLNESIALPPQKPFSKWKCAASFLAPIASGSGTYGLIRISTYIENKPIKGVISATVFIIGGGLTYSFLLIPALYCDPKDPPPNGPGSDDKISFREFLERYRDPFRVIIHDKSIEKIPESPIVTPKFIPSIPFSKIEQKRPHRIIRIPYKGPKPSTLDVVGRSLLGLLMIIGLRGGGMQLGTQGLGLHTMTPYESQHSHLL